MSKHAQHPRSRHLALVAGLTLSALTALATAVGGDSTIALAASTSTASSSKKVTITLAEFTQFQGSSYESKLALAQEFERRHPNISVKFVPIRGDQAIITRIAAGDPPDLFWIGESLQSMAARGMLYDLTPFVQKDKWDLGQYFPSLVQAFMYQNRLYGLPTDAAPMIQYNNIDLLESAGVSAPDADWDWNKFEAAARKSTVWAPDGKVTRYGFGMPFWTHTILPFIFQAGGTLLTADGKESAFDNPGTVEAFQFLERLMFEVKAMMPGPEEARKASYERFAAGQLPVLHQGAWLLSTYMRPIDSFNWSISPLPTGRKRATAMAFGGYAIPANAPHPEEAWEFLKFATSEEGQTLLAQTGFAAVMANRAAALKPENYQKAFGVPGRQLPVAIIPASMNYAFLEFPVPEYQDLLNALYGLLPEWNTGQTPAQQFVRKVHEQWEKVFLRSQQVNKK
jgi:multiple sugar transport system substrate-binding protein